MAIKLRLTQPSCQRRSTLKTCGGRDDIRPSPALRGGGRALYWIYRSSMDLPIRAGGDQRERTATAPTLSRSAARPFVDGASLHGNLHGKAAAFDDELAPHRAFADGHQGAGCCSPGKSWRPHATDLASAGARSGQGNGVSPAISAARSALRGWALVRESPYTETPQAPAAPRRCGLSTTAHTLPAPLPQATLHPDRQQPPTTPELHFSNASSVEVPKSLLPGCHPASVPTPRPCTNGGARPSRCIKARRAPRPQHVWCRNGCEPGVPDVPGWLDCCCLRA